MLEDALAEFCLPSGKVILLALIIKGKTGATLQELGDWTNSTLQEMAEGAQSLKTSHINTSAGHDMVILNEVYKYDN